MRVAIYGAGAIGTLFGAYVARSGKQIDLITRNIPHVRALNEHGAQIVGYDNFITEVHAITPDEMTGIYDIIFLVTKQRENAGILETLGDFLADDGVICTMQNGLPEPAIIEVVGRHRCMGCVVTLAATRVNDGIVSLNSKKNKMRFMLGSMEGSNPKTEIVKEYLECAGAVTVVENFIGIRWAKLSLNSALSPLSALTGYTFGEVVKNKYTREIALTLINEAFSVAAECGIKLEPVHGVNLVKTFGCKNKFKKFFVLRIMRFALKDNKDGVSGMFYDLRSERKCDISFVNGVVQRLGNKFGVETPANDAVIDFCLGVESGKRELTCLNAQTLYGIIKNKS